MQLDFELPENFKSLYKRSFITPTNQSIAEITESSTPRSPSPDLWEIALKEKFNDRKTWEDFSHPEPDKEKSFLTELGGKSQLWVENLPSVYISALVQDQNPVKPTVLPLSDFIKDLKYLLGKFFV